MNVQEVIPTLGEHPMGIFDKKTVEAIFHHYSVFSGWSRQVADAYNSIMASSVICAEHSVPVTTDFTIYGSAACAAGLWLQDATIVGLLHPAVPDSFDWSLPAYEGQDIGVPSIVGSSLPTFQSIGAYTGSIPLTSNQRYDIKRARQGNPKERVEVSTPSYELLRDQMVRWSVEALAGDIYLFQWASVLGHCDTGKGRVYAVTVSGGTGYVGMIEYPDFSIYTSWACAEKTGSIATACLSWALEEEYKANSGKPILLTIPSDNKDEIKYDVYKSRFVNTRLPFARLVRETEFYDPQPPYIDYDTGVWVLA